MVVFDIAILAPLFAGIFLGTHAIVRPASRPNFDRYFKKKYSRSEWNERNPETFTQKIGAIVLVVSILYGMLVVLPWVRL